MSASDCAVVFIPALTKSARFQNDLVKKLLDVPLIQRAIDNARLFGVTGPNIHLLTDSEEVSLFATRSDVGAFLNPTLSWESAYKNSEYCQYVSNAEYQRNTTILLSPYAPLLAPEIVIAAVDFFLSSDHQVLKPVRLVKEPVFDNMLQRSKEVAVKQDGGLDRVECSSFVLLRPGVLSGERKDEGSIGFWHINDGAQEIGSLQDWWVCEKLLQRRRIVFRIIGDNEVGMGHIYRAVTLAEELSDHEVMFVTDTANKVAAEMLLKCDYWLGVYEETELTAQVMALNPDMVIYDALDTDKNEIQLMKSAGSIVISFEDLGTGAQFTDLTINELYDLPQFEAGHILWGYKYFFLRDEFQMARPHRFEERVLTIMLAFGGTDQHDLSRRIFHKIRLFCKEQKIFIHIVTGPGYRGYQSLLAEIEKDSMVSLTHASGVISGIMEKTQLAITSNGRTVYELAHMNIPSIVIAQHKREITHAFANEENGFVSLGLYSKGNTESAVLSALDQLVRDHGYRRNLFQRMKTFRFDKNKQRVARKILQLLKKRMKSP